MLSRRDLLAGTAGLAAVSAFPLPLRAAAPTAMPLRAGPARAHLSGPDAPATDVLAYGGTVPGTLIRRRVGETLSLRFENRLEAPSTIHWHGLRLPNAMDGVPGMTQEAVPPGGDFTYAFTLRDAGTFWYHPHHATSEQAGRGLYGLLIVDEETPPPVALDAALVFDDWRLDETGAIHAASFGNLHDAAHAGRMGNVMTVNGKPAEALALRHGEVARLRLANVANARVFWLLPQGLVGHVVALDGRPCAPRPLGEVVLGPAQRMDLMVTPDPEATAPAGLHLMTREGPQQALVTVAVSGTPGTALPDTAIALPPGEPPPVARTGDVLEVPLALQGGAMGPLPEARHDGVPKDRRSLAEAGLAWALAGDAGHPPEPLFTVARGTPVRIRMPNETAWAHVMHVHGTHFTVESGGWEGDAGALRDTVLTLPQEETVISFVAEAPGDWLIHCHMLEHADTGMSTWFRVLG